MEKKKTPGRFTIQFNLSDPKQFSVSELLEHQGRHKAQFIANAVLHYIHCPETSDISAPQPVDRELLEAIVLEILNRQNRATQKGSHQAEHVVPNAPECTNEPQEELEKMFGKEGIAAIASTLTAFQHR